MNTHIYVMQIIIGSNEWIWATNQIQIYKNFLLLNLYSDESEGSS